MQNVKNVSIMLLIVFLAVACKDADKENAKLPSVEEYQGWDCPEDVGDVEWPRGVCINENGTLLKRYIASIYALLSNPSFFDKKSVVTCGYLSGIINDCSIDLVLYPSKEDALHNLFTNGLRVDVKEGAEIFEHMELPYGMYICLNGMFSLVVNPNNRLKSTIHLGFLDASIFIQEKIRSIDILPNPDCPANHER